MDSFVKKIQNFIFHSKLFSRGERILIGISGGPDSICLSRVLLELKDKHDLTLGLLHINYGLRGNDSDADETFVRDFAKNNSLELEVVKYKKEDTGGNLENKMRNFRYAQFEKFAKENNFNKIALAHTADDQTETFLMNLFRGSGAVGLGAMKVSRGKVIRPLLNFSKKEVIGWLEKINQAYRIDETNLKNDFFRNRIRNELIPLLERDYSKKIRERIFNLTKYLQEEAGIVEEIIEKKYNDIVQKSKGKVSVLVEDLQVCSIGQKKLLFRRIIKELKGDLKDVSSNNFFEFDKILNSKKSKIQKYIFGTIIIERKDGVVNFSLKQ